MRLKRFKLNGNHYMFKLYRIFTFGQNFNEPVMPQAVQIQDCVLFCILIFLIVFRKHCNEIQDIEASVINCIIFFRVKEGSG